MQRTKNFIPLKGMNVVASDARCSVNIQFCCRYSKFQAEVTCFIVPNNTRNVLAWYFEHYSWKLTIDLFYADPGFASPEDMHMLIGEELFFYLLCPGRCNGNGRVLTIQETELSWFSSGHVQHLGQPFGEAVMYLTFEKNTLDTQLQIFG
jgi:hypothetical protein